MSVSMKSLSNLLGGQFQNGVPAAQGASESKKGIKEKKQLVTYVPFPELSKEGYEAQLWSVGALLAFWESLQKIPGTDKIPTIDRMNRLCFDGQTGNVFDPRLLIDAVKASFGVSAAEKKEKTDKADSYWLALFIPEVNKSLSGAEADNTASGLQISDRSPFKVLINCFERDKAKYNVLKDIFYGACAYLNEYERSKKQVTWVIADFKAFLRSFHTQVNKLGDVENALKIIDAPYRIALSVKSSDNDGVYQAKNIFIARLVSELIFDFMSLVSGDEQNISGLLEKIEDEEVNEITQETLKYLFSEVDSKKVWQCFYEDIRTMEAHCANKIRFYQESDLEAATKEIYIRNCEADGGLWKSIAQDEEQIKSMQSQRAELSGESLESIFERIKNRGMKFVPYINKVSDDEILAGRRQLKRQASTSTILDIENTLEKKRREIQRTQFLTGLGAAMARATADREAIWKGITKDGAVRQTVTIVEGFEQINEDDWDTADTNTTLPPEKSQGGVGRYFSYFFSSSSSKAKNSEPVKKSAIKEASQTATTTTKPTEPVKKSALRKASTNRDAKKRAGINDNVVVITAENSSFKLNKNAKTSKEPVKAEGKKKQSVERQRTFKDLRRFWEKSGIQSKINQITNKISVKH